MNNYLLIESKIIKKANELLEIINTMLEERQFNLLCFYNSKNINDFNLQKIYFSKNDDYIEYGYSLSWAFSDLIFEAFIIELFYLLKEKEFKEVVLKDRKIIIAIREANDGLI